MIEPVADSRRAPLPAAQNLPAPRLPPPGAPYPDALMPQTNPWAIVSLAFGILGWCGLFGIGGLVSIATGLIARNQILTSYGMQSGEGLAIVGIILGALNVTFACVAAWCVFSLFGALVAGV